MRDDETADRLQPQLNRREILTLGAATAAVAGAFGLIAPALAPSTADALPPPAGEEVLQNANGFSVVIAGAPEASSHVLVARLEPLTVTTTAGTKSPKSTSLPLLRVTVPAGTAAADELQLWWQDTLAGQCARKDITINLRKLDGTTGRSYALFDCFPSQWSSVNFDTSSTVQTETLTVKVGRIEFKTS